MHIKFIFKLHIIIQSQREIFNLIIIPKFHDMSEIMVIQLIILYHMKKTFNYKQDVRTNVHNKRISSLPNSNS